jgi:HlyD family secretion protein
VKRFSTMLMYLVFAALPWLAGCRHRGADDSSGKIAAQVSTIQPRSIALTRDIEQPGYLRTYETTPLFAKIAGYVESVDVDIGDRVKKGQLLVKLRVPEMVQDLKVKEARIQQARADLKQAREAAVAAKATREAARARIKEMEAGIARAEAAVKRWQAEDERGQRLLRDKVFDRQTLDEIQNQLQVSTAARDEARAKLASARAAFDQSAAQYVKAEADIESAGARVRVTEAEFAQWKAWLDYSELRAPFDGVVTLRNVHTEHFLQPSNSGSTSKSADPLLVLMRDDVMRLIVQAPEKDSPLIHDGDRAVVRFTALPGREIIGKVTRSSSALDLKARTLRVEIHLKNPKGELKSGMYANVTIAARIPPSLTLPPRALLRDIQANDDRDYCFVVEDGKAVKTFLDLGVRGKEGVQVLRKMSSVGAGQWQPLTGREAIVISNPGALLDGQTVEARPAAAR